MSMGTRDARTAIEDAQDARTIVEWVLGTRAEPSASAGTPGGYDFDLVDNGRRAGILAVTRSARPAHPRPWGSVRRLQWDAAGLEWSWVVRFGPGHGPAVDRRMITGLLQELEQAGGEGFQRADRVRVAALRAAGVRLSPAERVIEDLAAFGASAAERSPCVPPRPVVTAKLPQAGSTSAEAVNEAVEDEAWRGGNRARLAPVDAGDRHLFVWLDEADVAAWAAMGPDVVPAPPLLTPEATTLWVARRPVAAAAGDLLADRLWQTDDDGRWDALGPVRRTASRPGDAGPGPRQAHHHQDEGLGRRPAGAPAPL